jgi:hypothetical protein
MVGEDADLVSDVFVEQAMGANADHDKQERMEEFVRCDEKQPPVVTSAAGAG